MKIQMANDKAIRGFATVAKLHGNEIALWHENMEGLQAAFEAVTKQTFHPALAQPVALYNLNKHQTK
jgi:hypothetical protein